METEGTITELGEETTSLSGRGNSKKQWEILDELGFLLSEHSPAEWTSFLKETYGGERIVVE